MSSPKDFDFTARNQLTREEEKKQREQIWQGSFQDWKVYDTNVRRATNENVLLICETFVERCSAHCNSRPFDFIG